jgi:hypothetical protein
MPSVDRRVGGLWFGRGGSRRKTTKCGVLSYDIV